MMHPEQVKFLKYRRLTAIWMRLFGMSLVLMIAMTSINENLVGWGLGLCCLCAGIFFIMATKRDVHGAMVGELRC